MVPEVAQQLARLGQRERSTRDDDPVFVNGIGGHIDASALRRRYAVACKRAELRPLPFHSLRHHFGSIAVNGASLVQVQAWMDHFHIQTTARYLHHRSQATDAALLAEALPARPSASAPQLGQPRLRTVAIHEHSVRLRPETYDFLASYASRRHLAPDELADQLVRDQIAAWVSAGV
jgi:Phage integrase family